MNWVKSSFVMAFFSVDSQGTESVVTFSPHWSAFRAFTLTNINNDQVDDACEMTTDFFLPSPTPIVCLYLCPFTLNSFHLKFWLWLASKRYAADSRENESESQIEEIPPPKWRSKDAASFCPRWVGICLSVSACFLFVAPHFRCFLWKNAASSPV